MKNLNVNNLNLDSDYNKTITTAGILANNKHYFVGYMAHFLNNNNIIITEADSFGQNQYGVFALINQARFGIPTDTVIELRKI